MKTENLARGLKLLALECNDKVMADKLWSLRNELIQNRIIKAQAKNIEDFVTGAPIGTYNCNYSLQELITAYRNRYKVSQFIAQHCVNHILGVSR